MCVYIKMKLAYYAAAADDFVKYYLQFNELYVLYSCGLFFFFRFFYDHFIQRRRRRSVRTNVVMRRLPRI